MESWAEYTRFSIGLLALVDPFTTIPLFLMLTAHLGSRDKVKTAIVAAMTVTVTLLIFQFAGDTIVTALGSSLPSFQIAGGIIIAIAGLQMLAMTPTAKSEFSDDAPGQSAAHLGIVPIGIPMLGGAGALAKVVVESHHGAGIDHQSAIAFIIICLGVVVAVVLALAAPIGRALGTGGLTVINRLAGVVVLAIAVEMIITGITTHQGLGVG